MTATLTIRLELEPGEEYIPEAVAVQRMQNALAAAARMTPDELAEIWRKWRDAATTATETSRRARHTHRGAKGGA